MIVTTVHSILGWIWPSTLLTETRHHYHYPKGNDVTVVERRPVHIIQAYSPQGHHIEYRSDRLGSRVDIRI